jgi:hypothetical protein
MWLNLKQRVKADALPAVKKIRLDDNSYIVHVAVDRKYLDPADPMMNMTPLSRFKQIK